VSAVVVVRWFLGNEPLFRVPAFQLQHPSELVIYAGIGVVGGVLSAGFIHVIEVVRRRLERLPHRTELLQALCGGICVGVAGLWLPEVMGAGYDAIDSALHGRFRWELLLILAGIKLLVTLICFVTGIPGGMFAPTLFVGAMLGGGLGGLARHYWAHAASPVSAYVLVGMGTFFAGVFRAPMTSIFMVFETSASYVIILPVMVANTISYFISRRLHPVPFFTMLARAEGVDLPSAEEFRSVEVMRVEDAMRPLPPGIDIDGLPRIYPDVTLDAAMRLLSSDRMLQVTSRADRGTPIGVLTLKDVFRAYGLLKSPDELD
jgi:CIC family chloride channel protein